VKYSSVKQSFIVLSVLLTSCGGGGASATPAVVPSTFLEARTAAEKSGVIPVLDRSTSLLGTDADNNSIRDDIDAYINSLPDTPAQKTALRQTAAALNATLTVDLANPAAVAAVDAKIMNSVGCMNDIYPGIAATNNLRDMEKFSANTKDRFVAYMKFNQALSGQMLSIAARGVGCAP
jgi:hypothetical protein